jgi:hypothetical protein
VLQSVAWQKTCTTHALLVDNGGADVLLGLLSLASDLVTLGMQKWWGALRSVQVEDLHSTCSVW